LGRCRFFFSNYIFPFSIYTPTPIPNSLISHNTLVTSHPQVWVPESKHPHKKPTPPTKHRVFRQNVKKVGCLNSAKKRPFYNVRLPKHTSLDSKTPHIRLIWWWSPPPPPLGPPSKSHKKAAHKCSLHTIWSSTTTTKTRHFFSLWTPYRRGESRQNRDTFQPTDSSIACENLRKMTHRALTLDLGPRTMYWGNLADSLAKLTPKFLGFTAIVRNTFPQLG
jgi:hypothetical protein